jgi:hypothetical protein
MKINFKTTVESNFFGPEAIMITGANFETIKSLISDINWLLSNPDQCLNLSDKAYIEEHNCDLLFSVSASSVGVKKHSDSSFLCEMGYDDYQFLIGQLEPFLLNLNGFQHICDFKEGVDVLFSPGGTW